jgi:hypothetical protein
LPNGTRVLKELLKMSWRALIISAVANSSEFFSAGFLDEAERCSPFRFEFLRARRDKLASRQGLYAILFDAFLDADDGDRLPQPNVGQDYSFDLNIDVAAVATAAE